MTFEWDAAKAAVNLEKHAVSFFDAQAAFFDPRRLILKDEKHSQLEERFFCIGRVARGIMTVRFTLRLGAIRIIGAGFWREGRQRYEEKYSV